MKVYVCGRSLDEDFNVSKLVSIAGHGKNFQIENKFVEFEESDTRSLKNRSFRSKKASQKRKEYRNFVRKTRDQGVLEEIQTLNEVLADEALERSL